MPRHVQPRAGSRARTEACLVDCLVALAWLLLLGGVAIGLRRLGLEPHWSATSELSADLAALALGLLPVGIYLVLSENGRLQGSLGKRRVGLRVVRADGTRANAWQLAMRTAIKLFPWFLAHLGLSRVWMHLGTQQTACLCLACVYVIVPISIGLALVHPQRRALHDWLTGTRVIAD
ncbi:RDD family protein [Kutzneria buriramensis]|uniref:RDD family protein n=1 Tax=Kutzneria buriramensis TaxID=1045776 RepID=UPI000E25127C|nr:RDD family protein [Kutzneria buriramensis]